MLQLTLSILIHFFHFSLLWWWSWRRRCQFTAIECLSEVEVPQSCPTLYSPWNAPGQNTGVGSFSLLRRIFPTQELNPGLLYCRWILYQLSQKESPRILEWVAYPFSSGFSWPRSRSRVSCIAGRFFTNWTIREGPPWPETLINSRTTNIFKALDNNIYPPNYAFSYFSKEHLKMPFYRLWLTSQHLWYRL